MSALNSVCVSCRPGQDRRANSPSRLAPKTLLSQGGVGKTAAKQKCASLLRKTLYPLVEKGVMSWLSTLYAAYLKYI